MIGLIFKTTRNTLKLITMKSVDFISIGLVDLSTIRDVSSAHYLSYLVYLILNPHSPPSPELEKEFILCILVLRAYSWDALQANYGGKVLKTDKIF
jgi:hypothetical protein